MVIRTAWTHTHLRRIARDNHQGEAIANIICTYIVNEAGKDVDDMLLIGVGQDTLTTLFHVHHQKRTIQC
eukprot:12727878-Ditylum_brightwellii.AAC.1